MGSWVKGKKAGEWLVKAAPGLEGRTIDVARRDGRTAPIRLDRCIWTGEGRALYTIRREGKGVTADRQTAPVAVQDAPQPTEQPALMVPVGPVVDVVPAAPQAAMRPHGPLDDVATYDGVRAPFDAPRYTRADGPVVPVAPAPGRKFQF